MQFVNLCTKCDSVKCIGKIIVTKITKCVTQKKFKEWQGILVRG